MQFHWQAAYRPYLMIGVAALLLLTGLTVLISRGAADDSPRPKRYDVLEVAIRQELAEQKTARQSQARQLEALKQNLVSQDATPAQLQELDKLVQAQNKDYDARVRRLQEWLELLESDPDRAVDGINQEAEALARDLRRLDQSLDIPPVRGRGAYSGGTSFQDPPTDPAATRERPAAAPAPDEAK